METIRVYHSPWKNGILILVCFVFAAIGIYSLVAHPERSGFMMWLGILFFGLGGIFMLWLVLKERITDRPYYVITDESVVMNSGLKSWVVSFADVEHFVLTGKMIGIRYKKNREIQKIEEAGWLGHMVRRFNQRVSGSQEHLYVSNMTMKPKELCNLLNKRLKRFSKQPRT